jgi:transcriptional regulator NrdR family protein
LDCKNTFTTYEVLALSYLKVKKRSGKVQRYSKAKLFAGIYHCAAESRNADRGQAGTKADRWTKEVERKLTSRKKPVLTTTEILETVLDVLSKKSLDVFIRFLAYKEQGDNKKIRDYLKKYIGL